MLFAWAPDGPRLVRVDTASPETQALWIDLYRPMPRQIEAMAALGVTVPSLAEMEEIELSNRLYREGGVDVMTVVLPGLSETKDPTAGPVTFILSPHRLVTVRHHAPRPFETYPQRSDKVGPGCDRPDRIFLGLLEEIIGRNADLLEGIGRALDDVAAGVWGHGATADTDEALEAVLARIGREGDLLGRVRLALLTIERAVSFFGTSLADRPDGPALRDIVKGIMRDIQALEVHADFLGQRIGLATDTTMGRINLAQNVAVRIVSVVSSLFLPPTLIASIYGMNFASMPELAWGWGYAAALAAMLASALFTYFLFRWRGWL